MIFVHVTHEVAGGKMEELATAVREGVQPELARRGEAGTMRRGGGSSRGGRTRLPRQVGVQAPPVRALVATSVTISR
ncbi:MAG: hypothetical protein ACREQJ_13455 [Candidatus Binatia bacterium]